MCLVRSSAILCIFFVLLIYSCKEEPISPVNPSNESCFFTEEEQSVIDELASEFSYPFLSANPEEEDPSLDHLIEYLSTAKIVGMGEATHGSKEFFQMKDKLFRQLVLQKEFKAIIFEIPWGNCLKVDEFVAEGIGTADDAINQTWYWVYDTEEVRALANWMHNYNNELASDKKIHFVGCDPQGPNFVIERAIVESYIKELDPNIMDSIYFHYGQLPYDLMEYDEVDQSIKSFNREHTEIVYQYLLHNRDAFVAATSNFEFEKTLMAAHVIQHREMMYRNQSFGVTRDSLMAVYSLWWQRIFEEDAKVAVWAHNAHVQHNDIGGKWMGRYLQDSLSNEYKNVGFSFGKGQLNAFYANSQGSFQSSVRDQVISSVKCFTSNAVFSALEAEQYYLIFDEIQFPSQSQIYFDSPHSFYQMGAGFNPSYLHNYTSKIAIAHLWDTWIHFDEVVASSLQ